MVAKGKAILGNMGFDVSGLVQVTQEGCTYVDYVDTFVPQPSASPTLSPSEATGG